MKSNHPLGRGEHDQLTRTELAHRNAKEDGLDQLAAPYLARVRACHEMASLLKRTRPQVRAQVEELEGIVTRSHQALDEATCQQQVSECLCNIEGAHQALLDLRRSRT